MEGDVIVLQTTGRRLWELLLFRLIICWYILYYPFLLVTSMLLPNPFLWTLSSLVGFFVAGFYTYRLVKGHLFDWNNEVSFDFAKRRITVRNLREQRINDDLLDRPEQGISFSNITYLKKQAYRGLFFSPVYRISIICSEQEVKLVALKSKDRYKWLLDRLQKAGIFVQ